jgi:hypothetical protein
MLKAWRNDAGKKLAVFSSGSVQAQRMFFGHVGVEGKAGTEDLNPLFDTNFDTINAGPKMEKGSYEKIAKELGMHAKPEGILFLSDNVNGKLPLPPHPGDCCGPSCLFVNTGMLIHVCRGPSLEGSGYAIPCCGQTGQRAVIRGG